MFVEFYKFAKNLSPRINRKIEKKILPLDIDERLYNRMKIKLINNGLNKRV